MNHIEVYEGVPHKKDIFNAVKHELLPHIRATTVKTVENAKEKCEKETNVRAHYSAISHNEFVHSMFYSKLSTKEKKCWEILCQNSDEDVIQNLSRRFLSDLPPTTWYTYEFFLRCNDNSCFTFRIKWIKRPSSKEWFGRFNENSELPDHDGVNEEYVIKLLRMNNAPELRVVPQEIVLNILSFSSFDYLHIYQRVSKFFKEHLKPFEFNAAKNENLRHIKISTKEALEKVKNKTTKQRSREEHSLVSYEDFKTEIFFKKLTEKERRCWEKLCDNSDGNLYAKKSTTSLSDLPPSTWYFFEYFIQCNDGTYFTFDIKWIQRPSSREWDSVFGGSDGEDDDNSPGSHDPNDDGLDEELMF